MKSHFKRIAQSLKNTEPFRFEKRRTKIPGMWRFKFNLIGIFIKMLLIHSPFDNETKLK